MNKSLKEYVNTCILWTSTFEMDIEKNGHCVGINKVIYNSKDDLYKDIKNQIEKLIDTGELIADISVEEAILFLKK